MSRQTHIFATRSDLLPGLERIEAQNSLKYVLSHPSWSPEPFILNSLRNYNRLGISRVGDHNRGDAFFVFHRECPVRSRKQFQFLGFTRYQVDNQTLNPESIVFRPGGLYQKKYLICGHIGTASRSEDSLELYKQFTKAMITGFQKIGSYYLGEEALQLMKKGHRLITMGIDEPETFDLRL